MANTPQQDAHNRLRALRIPFKLSGREHFSEASGMTGTWVECMIFVPVKGDHPNG